MKRLLLAVCFFAIILAALAQQQDPTEMQNQMNAADQPQSAVNAPLFKTPLKTYQQYYTAFTNANFKVMASCYTDTFKSNEFDGHNPTDQDYINMANKLNRDYLK